MQHTIGTSKPSSLLTVAFIVLIALCTLEPATVNAQQVSVQISSREAYVGSPIVLQLQIQNAQNYSLPEAFEIDGCDVQPAGSPSQSSQITIYNGRRSESQSVTMQYRITPRRKGTFEIPKLEIEIDGKTKTTELIRFVATKSETGDLLFVEIEGKEKSVYVGEPLELTLKIWIKPFQDRQNKIKLDESNMWQLLADSTNWGSFSDRIQELAENRQRPGGKPVLRDNGQGDSREYFLYELEATVYPTKPGKIDGDDVQIVLNYPLELGRSRDPFDSFFDDSPFGGSSLMKQMMDDDFLGGSPFGRRLTVSKSRPIVANANVDSTTVLPIPSEGKPLDYRGAIGRYRIIAQTESKTVDAGDPVTLQIGVVGDGPMDLVQAPPLAELSELTAGFKVEDQSLAGFVQDDTKVFVTTIRPRSPSVTEVPPIPFSFFDPEKETFETVYSKPIPLTVNKSETLSLDSIVSGSNSSRDPGIPSDLAETDLANPTGPNFENSFSLNLLSNRQTGKPLDWRLFAIVPPLVWLTLLLVRSLIGLGGWLPNFRTAETRAVARLQKASTETDLQNALIQFIADRSKQTIESSPQAAGTLRVLGLATEANEIESYVAKLIRNRMPISIHPVEHGSALDFQSQKNDAIAQVRKLNCAMVGSKKSSIKSKRRQTKGALQKSTASLLFLALMCCQGFAAQNGNEPIGQNGKSEQRLTKSQLQGIFEQANQSYRKASESAKTDSAEAKVAFAAAATQYQTIADQGIRNCDLYINLANAQWQSNLPGKAIANFHRALRCDPTSTKAAANLRFAQTQINLRKQAKNDNDENQSDQTLGEVSWDWLQLPIRAIGLNTITIAFASCSVIFWALVALRTCWMRFSITKWASVPLLVMLTTGVFLFAIDYRISPIAVAVVDQVEVHAGDGFEFEINWKIESAMGQQFSVLSKRGDWLHVLLPGSSNSIAKEGWVHQSQVEAIRDRKSFRF